MLSVLRAVLPVLVAYTNSNPTSQAAVLVLLASIQVFPLDFSWTQTGPSVQETVHRATDQVPEGKEMVGKDSYSR